MQQDRGPEAQTSAPKRGMSSFWKALLWTAVPILALAIISTVGAIASHGLLVFNVFGGVVAGVWPIAILAAVGFAIARKRQIAAGILAGAAIGVLGLAATCFTGSMGW